MSRKLQHHSGKTLKLNLVYILKGWHKLHSYYLIYLGEMVIKWTEGGSPMDSRHM